jgi:hypothetical protein
MFNYQGNTNCRAGTNWIRSVVSYVALALLFGCGGSEPLASAEVAAKVGEEQPSSSCPSIDATEPEVARILAGAKLIPMGEPTVRYETGRKISSMEFKLLKTVEGVDGTADHEALLDTPVKVTCTSSCNGSYPSFCSSSGCDASQWGCSSYSCNGSSCTGSCTKTSTYTHE